MIGEQNFGRVHSGETILADISVRNRERDSSVVSDLTSRAIFKFPGGPGHNFLPFMIQMTSFD